VLVGVLATWAARVVMDRTTLPPSVGDDPGEVTGKPGPELLWTKLVAPAPRAGLVPRAGLLSLLQASLQAKLCLVAAPAGSGKTTLLAQWRAVAVGVGQGSGVL
jgi:hypothetical protein